MNIKSIKTSSPMRDMLLFFFTVNEEVHFQNFDFNWPQKRVLVRFFERNFLGALIF